MTRKHFVALAAAVNGVLHRHSPSPALAADLINALSHVCGEANEAFDQTRFEAACLEDWGTVTDISGGFFGRIVIEEVTVI